MRNYFENNKLVIDPKLLKSVTLNNGITMPGIGIGTFGSDLYSADQVADAVIHAAEVGQRSFDCASVYGNEQKIGKAFQVILDGGVSREELFITSKVWNDMHGEGEVIASCKQTLSDLGLDYLDMYLVHWPFPNFHPPGCSVESRSADSKPYIHEDYMIVWRQMEQLVEEGLVRSIGTSNMTIPKMNLLLEDFQQIILQNYKLRLIGLLHMKKILLTLIILIMLLVLDRIKVQDLEVCLMMNLMIYYGITFYQIIHMIII